MLIHNLVTRSRVNGPGVRAVVYFQGCNLGCRLCWNPETHAFTDDEERAARVGHTTNSILFAHGHNEIEGVTFSGGEPMQQADDLLVLMESIHARLPELSFGMYSGYSEQELASGRYWCRTEQPLLARQGLWHCIRQHLDFAVLGRYVARRPSALPLRTSANQKLKLFSDRYREQDFEPQEIEVHIGESGLVQVTGFPVAGAPV